MSAPRGHPGSCACLSPEQGSSSPASVTPGEMGVAIWVEETCPPGTQPHVILGHQQNLDQADGGCGENITDAVSGSWGGGVAICHRSASLRNAKALLASLVGTLLWCPW